MEPALQCEDMDAIDIRYIFLNNNALIDKIESEKHVFGPYNGSNTLTKEMLIKYVQNKRTQLGIRYKLKDILVYLVNLEPDKLKEFSHTQDIEYYSNAFFKKLPILDDIKIQPTLYLFHNINSIFVVFQEPEPLPPSILKNGEIKRKNTKKVRISPDVSISTFDSNKTHKNLH